MDLVTSRPLAVRENTRPSTRLTVGLSTFGLLAVTVWGLTAARTGSWNARELVIVHWANAHHVTALDAVARALGTALSPAGTMLLLIGLGAAVASREGTRRGLITLLVGAVSWLGSWPVKELVHRSRPDVSLLVNPVPVDSSFAYPSGHAVAATVIVLTALFARDWRRCRWSVMVAATFVTAAAASRVYLGAHYPSDVIAGVVYAACVFVLVTAAVSSEPIHRLQAAIRLPMPGHRAGTAGTAGTKEGQA